MLDDQFCFKLFKDDFVQRNDDSKPIKTQKCPLISAELFKVWIVAVVEYLIKEDLDEQVASSHEADIGLSHNVCQWQKLILCIESQLLLLDFKQKLRRNRQLPRCNRVKKKGNWRYFFDAFMKSEHYNSKPIVEEAPVPLSRPVNLLRFDPWKCFACGKHKEKCPFLKLLTCQFFHYLEVPVIDGFRLLLRKQVMVLFNKVLTQDS